MPLPVQFLSTPVQVTWLVQGEGGLRHEERGARDAHMAAMLAVYWVSFTYLRSGSGGRWRGRRGKAVEAAAQSGGGGVEAAFSCGAWPPRIRSRREGGGEKVTREGGRSRGREIMVARSRGNELTRS